MPPPPFLAASAALQSWVQAALAAADTLRFERLFAAAVLAFAASDLWLGFLQSGYCRYRVLLSDTKLTERRTYFVHGVLVANASKPVATAKIRMSRIVDTVCVRCKLSGQVLTESNAGYIVESASVLQLHTPTPKLSRATCQLVDHS